ncbi:hypothetical protein ACFW9N_22350 [Streptomyces sp. NPDC059496]|uniref:hypothetical protein n=1 Tax=Streptomyces sp. NPDC059496 TaxID=3346851 RepID=UPI00368B8911
MTGVAGASTATASDSSATALSCSNRQYFPGSLGHAGGSVRCTGSAFVAKATCFKRGYGTYYHYGNRVETGGTSTVWCDLDATMEYVTGLSS